MSEDRADANATMPHGRAAEVFTAFLKLGVTSFGGPIAHLGYFRDEFVSRRRWLDEASYADILALCQFLPGPASSQVGITLGLLRGGLAGALCAWLGFTGPSALAMILFGYGVGAFGDLGHAAWLHGLKIVAVAVVAQAVWAAVFWPKAMPTRSSNSWTLYLASSTPRHSGMSPNNFGLACQRRR